MSRFYTSITRNGVNVVERYVENGEHKMNIEEFKPELFVTSLQSDTGYKSTSGLPLERVEFDNMYAMDEFLERMKSTSNYRIYGIDNILAQYVAKYYPNKEIKFDMKLIKGAILDIEVESGEMVNGEALNGPFPEPADAFHPITAITTYATHLDTFFVYGLERFKGQDVGTFDIYKLPPHIADKLGNSKVEYKGFDDEKVLLLEFTALCETQQFNFISGWNSDTFDIPYICNRIDALLGRETLKRISPLGYVRKRTFQGKYGEEVTFTIGGVSNLDLKDIIAKHAFVELDNAKLNTAALHFLKEEKADYSQYKNLTEFYYFDYQNYIAYNIRDVDLVKRIAEKTKFLQLAYTLAFLFHCNPDDTTATVLPWQYLMYSYGSREHEYSEIRPRVIGKPDYVGGYVKDVVPGNYKWVMSSDANALYPHMAQQFNMGIETLVPVEIGNKVLDALAAEMDNLPEEEKNHYTRTYADRFKRREAIWDIYFEHPYNFATLKKLNICMAPNLAFFKTDKESLLRKVFRDLYSTRKVIKNGMKDKERALEGYKKTALANALDKTPEYFKHVDDAGNEIQNDDNNQHAHKIAANAGYGAIANENFVDHFDIRIAEAITTAGQCSTRHIMYRLNEWINKTYNLTGDHCFYGDTDSIYTEFDGVVKACGWDKLSDQEITDKLDNLMNDVIEPMYITWAEELATSYNCPINALFFKREAIAISAIFTTKKRYAMLLTDNEGVRYAQPKLKVIGLESRKANYPKFCRDWLQDCYKLALLDQKEELHKFVSDAEHTFINVKQINDYGAAQNINNIEQYIEGHFAAKKGTPYHVKGAINHNRLVHEKSLTHIKPLRSGNKYFILPLRKGSPFGMEVIAYDEALPKEFGLDSHIDKDQAFEKTFIKPLTNFLTAINWEPKASTTFSLDSLF